METNNPLIPIQPGCRPQELHPFPPTQYRFFPSFVNVYLEEAVALYDGVP